MPVGLGGTTGVGAEVGPRGAAGAAGVSLVVHPGGTCGVDAADRRVWAAFLKLSSFSFISFA